MADHRAIAAVCETVIAMLRNAYRFELFGHNLDFKVYTTADFERPMAAGVSLYLYRIEVNGAQRNPILQRGSGGSQHLLPLDLHFLLTAWGTSASLQNTIAAWAMRVLADTPSLGAGQLNSLWAEVFNQDESVEVLWESFGNDEITQLWDTFIRRQFQLSVPYMARVVQLEPLKEQAPVEPVGVREFRVQSGKGADQLGGPQS